MAFRCTILAMALSVPLATAFAQSAGDVQPIASADAVTCEDFGKKSSNPVKSAAGFTAVVEVRAAREGNGQEQRCITSWILHVSGPHVAPKSIEVQSREDRPNDNDWGDENSFDVIGWSKDGIRILTSAVMAAGDWDETTPVIYDFQARKSWRVELDSVFSKVVPKGCLVYFRPIRLAANGGVLIFVAPREAEDRCFVTSIWSLN
jgi:hypothetical protein